MSKARGSSLQLSVSLVHQESEMLVRAHGRSGLLTRGEWAGADAAIEPFKSVRKKKGAGDLW